MDREQTQCKLRSRTRRELVELATELKIVGRHRMRKEQLVQAIAGTRMKKGSGKPRPAKAPRPATRRRRAVRQSLRPLLEEKGTLPDSYGETKVLLLPVDPSLIHSQWEVSPSDLEKTRLRLGSDYERSRAVLRFYDITDIIFDGSNAHKSFDVDVDLQAKTWYVRLQIPGRSYCVDLGMRTEDGRFFPVARSNIAETPRAWPSKKMEKIYMLVEGNFDRVEQISEITRPQGPSPLEGGTSFDLTEMTEKLFTSGISSKP